MAIQPEFYKECM